MAVHSPFPSVAIPIQDIVSFFFGLAQARLDKINGEDYPLLIDGSTGKSYNFVDIKQMSTAIAHGLKHRVFINEQSKHQSPDVDIDGGAMMFSPADIGMSAIHYGTLMAGGTFAPIDTNLDAQSLSNRLECLNASAAFVTAELLPTLLSACNLAGVSINESRIFITQGDIPGYTSLAGFIDEHKNLCVEPLIFLMSEQELARKVALISYSSGTTGNFKGIMLTHCNIVTAYVLLYHPLISGLRLVQLSEFNPASYLAAIDKFEVDRLYVTLWIIQGLVDGSSRFEDGTLTISSDPERKFITESVRTIVCAGTSILPTRLKKFMTYFSRATVFNGYGATETSFIVASCKWKEPAPSTPLSLYPDTFATVVDEDGNETNGYGELCILGPRVMVG
ncbi:hypothetical protein LPJ66_001176 [Kickxella alabastrina]|uniref:Uncharacterized protein n=1 Tax=Kickxella alabastrina TaxID=61397 RepID=A0ACC1ITY7_9FUNG|nr:hypothetical protein LPJ66_001176 [Kickxella alabastrina]